MQRSIPLWRDERFRRLLFQALFLIAVGLLLGYLIRNLLLNLSQQGMQLGFGFLRLTAGFDIGESLIPYDRGHTFLQALQVGLLNTLLVSVVGIFFATLIGVFFGVARISGNYLVGLLAQAYIELMRNIPLLVLLIFLYRAVFIKLPRVKEALTLPGPILLTNRGVAIPWGLPTPQFRSYLLILLVGLALAIALGAGLTWAGKRTGRAPLAFLWGLLFFVAVAVLGWALLPAAPLKIDAPALQGLRIAGGQQLSPEFMALLAGLVLYTSAFIADVVRAGVQSVPYGQVEAAKSLGLTGFMTLRLVVFPQALRVIIPPLTSQFLNLIKNSSLAVAVGYPDLFSVSGTILNQSGRAVEMFTVVMAIYLAVSLVTSAFMNWYNRRVRLVER